FPVSLSPPHTPDPQQRNEPAGRPAGSPPRPQLTRSPAGGAVREQVRVRVGVVDLEEREVEREPVVRVVVAPVAAVAVAGPEAVVVVVPVVIVVAVVVVEAVVHVAVVVVAVVVALPGAALVARLVDAGVRG